MENVNLKRGNKVRVFDLLAMKPNTPINCCVLLWNLRGVDRKFFIDIVEELFNFSKPITMDDTSYFMIEDNNIGYKPSMDVYLKLLNQSYDVIDYNPITNLVRFYLHTGEVASNNIRCFKSNIEF